MVGKLKIRQEGPVVVHLHCWDVDSESSLHSQHNDTVSAMDHQSTQNNSATVEWFVACTNALWFLFDFFQMTNCSYSGVGSDWWWCLTVTVVCIVSERITKCEPLCSFLVCFSGGAIEENQHHVTEPRWGWTNQARGKCHGLRLTLERVEEPCELFRPDLLHVLCRDHCTILIDIKHLHTKYSLFCTE